MWKVDGIKIERTRARNFFLQTDKDISEKRKFFTLQSVTHKRKEIFGWGIKGQMMDMPRGPNAFLAKSGFGAVLTLF